MLEHLVSIEAVRALWVMRVGSGFRSRAGRAGLHVGDDLAFDQARSNQREQSQLERAGETSRIRDACCFFDLIAIHFRQAINEVSLSFHCGVFSSVELFEHSAMETQRDFVYGLTEVNRNQ